MKRSFTLLWASLLLNLLFFLPGCAVAGGIFKAGIWVGVLIVAAVVGLILFLINKGSNKN